MLHNLNNSEFYKTMDLFNEIDEFNDLLLFEKSTKLDSAVEGYEDLQSKYSILHENYAKEIENSKKVEKCLVKCLKFYSKLCKKYEIQQKIIADLEASIKEKISSLEEAQRNETKLKGLIEVYRTERTLYAGQTTAQLRKDKELLLEICCKLLSESVKSSNTRSCTNLLLRKFKSDLDDEKISLIGRHVDRSTPIKINPDVDCKEECTKSTESLGADYEECIKDKIKLDVDYKEEYTKSRVNVDVDVNCGESTKNEIKLDVDFEKESLKSETNLDTNCREGFSTKDEIKLDVDSEEKSTINSDVVDSEEKSTNTINSDVVDSEEKSTNTINSDVDSEEESEFPYEIELTKIFREMTSVRVLSPLREVSDSHVDNNTCTIVPRVNENSVEESGHSLKRNSEVEENCNKSKRLKPEEGRSNCGLLDSILSAMSLQNEEFKSNGVPKKESDAGSVEFGAEAAGRSPSRFRNLGTRTYSRVKKLKVSKETPVVCHSQGNKPDNQKAVDKIVAEEIKNFVSSPMCSKEEADKNVKHCISVLFNKSEDMIAKCIVAVVLENVDEPVEVFERPAPPLTKTQHRLIVLLSVFQNLYPNSEKISTKILCIISEKLFPDNFFWPDDSVESVTRFYAALCRARNDPKTLWRFCLDAMTEMRQRCPLLMFTVLKTWPDVLHDASVMTNNLLAVTIVNIFLHMPKTEGLRNFNQGRKLVALKHLLMNFYQFKMEDTIEGYAAKLSDALCREELGSEKAIVLLAKCRDQSWTAKKVIPPLQSRLTDWFEGKLGDSVGNRILSVMKQICPVLLEDLSNRATIKNVVSCLSDILNSRKKNHDVEVNIIEVLLQLKQFPEVRRVIREWIPKNPIDDRLRNQIIDASAENILRELKLNRKKEPRSFSVAKKLKKQSKKSKAKKKKGKKRKKGGPQKPRESVGVSS